MTAKTFFKQFKWEAFVPAALGVVLGVLTSAMYPAIVRSAAAEYAYEYVAFLLLALSSAAVIAAYFLSRNTSALFLVSGMGTAACAVYLCAPPLVKWSVVPIALGISVILNAASEFYEGLRARKEGGKAIARAVLAVLFAAAGVVCCLRLCPDMKDDWIVTGVLYLAQALCALVFTALGGLFEKEETLKFRPVKSARNGAEPAAGGDGENADDEAPAEEGNDARRRGAHRR